MRTLGPSLGFDGVASVEPDETLDVAREDFSGAVAEGCAVEHDDNVSSIRLVDLSSATSANPPWTGFETVDDGSIDDYQSTGSDALAVLDSYRARFSDVSVFSEPSLFLDGTKVFDCAVSIDFEQIAFATIAYGGSVEATCIVLLDALSTFDWLGEGAER